MFAIAIVILLALLLVLLGVGLLAGNFMVELALNPKVDKSRALDADHNRIDQPSNSNEIYQARRQWLEETGYVTRQIKSVDGLSLNGYFVENQGTGGTWAIVCHGYNGWGLQLLGPVEHFHRMGFNVLMPDARACGDSQGSYTGMGWPDRLDLAAWIEYLNAEYAPANIILYGVSMGGATVMMASGEALPPNVRAVVEDCGYTNAMDELSYQLKAVYKLPRYPLMAFATLLARMKAGYWLGEASAVKQVAKSKIPTLFIHGSIDTFVPAFMLEEVYQAASAEKEKLLVDGAGHGGAAKANPKKYWDTVEAFLQKHLE